MSDSLLRRAQGLALWLDSDDAHGPGCQTPERMNEIRDLLIDICAALERLDQ